MTLFGVDLSDHNTTSTGGPVNVASMAADGIGMLTYKATEGTVLHHKRTGATLAAARAAGIPYLGVYCVPRTPGNSGNGSVAQQVQYLLDYANSAVPWWRDHPGWFWQVDLEHWSNSKGVYDAVAPSVGVEMVRLLRQATGRPVVLYAPRWAYGDGIGGDAPLWASDYGKNPSVPYRQAYPGDASTRWARYSGRTPLVLQFGSRCQIGTQPGCDANAIRDERAWKALFSNGGTDIMATDATTTKLDDIYKWARAAVTGRDPDGKPFLDSWDGGGPYGNRQIAEKLDEVLAQLGAAPAGQAIDYDVLAAKVAPLVVEQLRPTMPTNEGIAMAVLRQLLPGAGATAQQS